MSSAISDITVTGVVFIVVTVFLATVRVVLHKCSKDPMDDFVFYDVLVFFLILVFGLVFATTVAFGGFPLKTMKEITVPQVETVNEEVLK